MIHKGVEFTVTQAAPGVWRWQFRIGDKVKTGKTEAKLHLLAIRRVQLRIDRELKKANKEPQSGSAEGEPQSGSAEGEQQSGGAEGF